MSYWDNEVVRLPQDYQYTLSLQRQVVEAACNGNAGAHLMSTAKNINQQSWSLRETVGRDVLQAPLNSAAGANAGITAPYTQIYKDFGNGVSVAQALGPIRSTGASTRPPGRGTRAATPLIMRWF